MGEHPESDINNEPGPGAPSSLNTPQSCPVGCAFAHVRVPCKRDCALYLPRRSKRLPGNVQGCAVSIIAGALLAIWQKGERRAP